jgi:peptidoglycan hydrolase CwlO-like protein
MNNTYNKLSQILCNRTTKKVLFLLSMIISILCLITIFSLFPKSNNDLKKQVDDLQKHSEQLLKAQAKYDSTINNQKAYVTELEGKIANIKERTTVIKEYYTTVKERVNAYDHAQIDSFFRQKYNY